MQATVWIALGSDSAVSDRAIASRKSSLTANKGAIVTLQLEQDYFTRLEQIQLSHRIDTSSPLYRARKVHLQPPRIGLLIPDAPTGSYSPAPSRLPTTRS